MPTLTGYPTSRMLLPGVYRSSEPKVRLLKFHIRRSRSRHQTHKSTVTDMLLSILAVCSSEELREPSGSSDGGDTTSAIGGAVDDGAEIQIREQRRQIKNKILAVGRMQNMFKLLRSVPSLPAIFCGLQMIE